MAKYAKIAGIYPVFWKNKDGSKVQKFRVKKTLNKRTFDALFDTFDEAKNAIENFITPAYQQHLNAQETQAKKDQFSPDLQSLFKLYVEKFSVKKSAKTYLLEKMYFTKIFPETLMHVEPISTPFLYAQMRNVADEKRLLRFGDLLETQVKTMHVERYILQRKAENIKESTIRRELSSMSAFFAKIPLLILRAEYSTNPFYNLVKNNYLTEKIKMRQRRLSAEEEKRLLEALANARSKRIPHVINFALTTGLRQSEMLNIRWDKIDLQKRTICIPSADTKNAEIHYVAIHSEVQNLIEEFRLLNPPKSADSLLIGYTAEGLKSTWERLLKRAKIEDFHWHDLRHEFISRLAEAGHNLYEVKAFSNSKHIKHLEKKIAPVGRAKAAQRLALGGRMQEGDMQAVMNHKTATMTAGYTNISADTITKNKEILAMQNEILKLKNMVQILTNKQK